MTGCNLRKELDSRWTVNSQIMRDASVMRHVLIFPSSPAVSSGSTCPFLVMLSGLPGTGKSYFARKLVQRVPFLVLESDRLRKSLVPDPKYTRGEHARVFAACHMLLEEFLGEGRRVLLDATNLTEQYRQPVYRMADQVSAPLVIIRFTAPEQTVRKRLTQRAAGLDPENYSDASWLIHTRLRQGAQPIEREHITVDTSGDIGPVLEEIARLVGTDGEDNQPLGVQSG